MVGRWDMVIEMPMKTLLATPPLIALIHKLILSEGI